MSNPNIAFVGLTACFGCQLTLLNCEEELADMSDSPIPYRVDAPCL